MGKSDTREIKPKQQKSRNMTSYKIKRHPTTVDNVSTFYCLKLALCTSVEIIILASYSKKYGTYDASQNEITVLSLNGFN